MRSTDHPNGETPKDQSSKKVRLEDVVVPTPPAGADDVVVDHSHDHRLDLSLSPPRNNNINQETAPPAPPIVPPPRNNINLHRQETAPPPPNNMNLYRPELIVPPLSPRYNIDLHLQETAPPAPIVPPPSPLPSPRPPPNTESFLSTIPMPPQYTGSRGLYWGLVPPPPPPPLPSSTIPVVSHSPRPTRQRKNTAHHPKKSGKSATVEPPFPWAENKRATVRSVRYLVSNQINTIKGEVQCKRCEKRYEMEYNLVEKFTEVWKFVAENRGSMNDRAPAVWMNPTLLTCKYCNQENSVRPVVAEKKREINWLFLLLGQMLGCCTLDQLKYFCKHTKNHRTGAKDRVLYLTYLGLCKQLNPNGPFNHPFVA